MIENMSCLVCDGPVFCDGVKVAPCPTNALSCLNGKIENCKPGFINIDDESCNDRNTCGSDFYPENGQCKPCPDMHKCDGVNKTQCNVSNSFNAAECHNNTIIKCFAGYQLQIATTLCKKCDPIIKGVTPICDGSINIICFTEGQNASLVFVNI